MTFLLDTHVLLWLLAAPERLRAETRRAIAEDDNEVFVSVVSLWEIVFKRRVGKLEAEVGLILKRMAPASKMQLLRITPGHLASLDGLPFYQEHRDPFDHLLIAQAISDGMTFVTQDRHAPLYSVRIMAP